MALQKVKALSDQRGSLKELDEDFKRRYPTLAEYLTAVTFDDGEVRELSNLVLFAGDVCGLKAVLNDPTNGRSLWVTGESLPKLLVALETLLNDEKAPWQARDQGKGKKGR